MATTKVPKARLIGVKNLVLKNQTTVAIDIKRMLEVSPKKSKAKSPPPNSTLNPETNSDSPSAKSKGARLVSATVLVNHTTIIGTNRKQTGNLLKAALSQEKETKTKAEKRRINRRLTS